MVYNPLLFNILASDADKPEGDSGSTPFVFTVTRNYTNDFASVAWSATSAPDASANAADFVGGIVPQGTLSFVLGEASKTITIGVQGDVTGEADEAFRVVLSHPSYEYFIGTSTATGIIRNDDPSLSIVATDAVQTEGDSGSTPFVFTVTRAGSSANTDTVLWSAVGRTATPANAADFAGGVVPQGTLTFAPGVTSQTIAVDVQGDLAAEGDEGFAVALSGASGGVRIVTAEANGTILNDDTTVSIAAVDAVKREGNVGPTNFVFRVTRGGNLAAATTVDWLTSGTGAHSVGPNDFVGGVAPAGSLSFAAGQASADITIAVQGDAYVEPDEQFMVLLRNASPGTTIVTNHAGATILNDDQAGVDSHSLSITANSASLAEGTDYGGPATQFLFTVARGGRPWGVTTVDWRVSSIGADGIDRWDFSGFPDPAPHGTLTFTDGQSLKTIAIGVLPDIMGEADEPFTVTLSNPSNDAEIDTAGASTVILNDDPVWSITPLDAVKAEGNGGATPFTFTVSRTGNTANVDSVHWVLVPVSPGATASDFVGGTASGVVSLAAGEVSKAITVMVQGDTLIEADDTFRVQLYAPSFPSAVVGLNAVGTILNDDYGIAIAATDATKYEGNSGTTDFTFTLTRTGPVNSAATVDWLTSGVGPNSVGPNDFVGGVAPAGTATFAPGAASTSIVVAVQGDPYAEPDERFMVLLRNPSSALGFIQNNAIATILNDDGPVGDIAAAIPNGAALPQADLIAGPAPLAGGFTQIAAAGHDIGMAAADEWRLLQPVGQAGAAGWEGGRAEW